MSLPCVCALLVSLDDPEEEVLEFIDEVTRLCPEKVVRPKVKDYYTAAVNKADELEKLNKEAGEFIHPYFLLVPESGPRYCIEDAVVGGEHFDVARTTVLSEEEMEEYMEDLEDLCDLNSVFSRFEDESVIAFARRLFPEKPSSQKKPKE